MSLPAILLLPFTLIYSAAVRLRNHLFDIGYSRTFSFDVPVIVVGNLSAGGTGKTPMVESIVRHVMSLKVPAVLSRGYKRQTRGLRLADDKDTPATIGDEPYQIYQKFNKEVTVCVAEDRVTAIPEILFQNPGTNVIIMDDGYQHRSVDPNLAVLLTEYSKPFYGDLLLPSGRLREPRKEAGRADAIVVTKCPKELGKSEKQSIVEKIRKYSHSDAPIFFSRIDYETPKPLNGNYFNADIQKVFVLTALANPMPFLSYVGDMFEVVGSHNYRDHHYFTEDQIRQVLRDIGSQCHAIICTEKDAVKLRHVLGSDPDNFALPIFYVPIRSRILDNGKEFERMLDASVAMEGPGEV